MILDSSWLRSLCHLWWFWPAWCLFAQCQSCQLDVCWCWPSVPCQMPAKLSQSRRPGINRLELESINFPGLVSRVQGVFSPPAFCGSELKRHWKRAEGLILVDVFLVLLCCKLGVKKLEIKSASFKKWKVKDLKHKLCFIRLSILENK